MLKLNLLKQPGCFHNYHNCHSLPCNCLLVLPLKQRTGEIQGAFSAPGPMNLSRANTYIRVFPSPPYIVESTCSFCLIQPDLLTKIICGLTSFCWFLSFHSQQTLCMWFPGNVSCCLCQPHTLLSHRVFQWGFHWMFKHHVLFAILRMFY